MKVFKKKLVCLAVAMLLAAGAATAQGMGIYGGLSLGYGQFGADSSPKYRGSNTSVLYYTRFNAFALTPVVGIMPWQGSGDFLGERMAFEFQLAMKWGKHDTVWGEASGSEIRPGVLLKYNFSIADWAELFGNSGPSWGDRLATYAGVGFGVAIKTGESTVSNSIYKGLYEDTTKNTEFGIQCLQFLMEFGANFKVNDKLSLNLALAGLGLFASYGPTYDLTVGVNYHFK